MPLEIFIAYAHADELLKNELVKHLSPLRRTGLIQEWHDRRIKPGAEWEHEIDRHVNRCGIVLLLISADFIHSDYCYAVEMKRALERHGSGDACVVPIILRPCDWQALPFGKLQALPKDGLAVSTWADRDEAFTDIARGIRLAAEKVACVVPEESGPASASGLNDLSSTTPQYDGSKKRRSVNQSQRSGNNSVNIQSGRNIRIGGGKNER